MKRLLAAAFGVALIAASCGGGGGSPAASPATPSGTDIAVGPTGSPSPAPSASPAASSSHAPLGTVRLALDWTPNTNHTGFYVAAANGWYGDAGVDFRVLPYGTHRSRGARRRRAGGMRDQLPGFADLRGRGRCADRVGHGDPPAHRAGHRRPRRLHDRPSARPRRPDLRGLRLPERGADAEGGHQGGWRQGHVQDRDPRHRGVRRAVRQARRLRDHVHRLGGRRGEGAWNRHPDVRLRRLRVPRLLPGRAGLQPALAGRQAGARPRVPGGDRPRLPARGRPIRTLPPRC